MIAENIKNIEKYPNLYQYTHPVKKAEREIIGRKKECESILASFLRPELCNVLLLGDAGSGKGNRLSEWIAVNDERGYIRFGDLRVGDQVFDENGFAVTVTGIYPQGKKKIYRVHFTDGTYMDCNDEHLWNVRNYNKHLKGIDEYETLELKDLIKYPYGYKKGRDGKFGNKSFRNTNKAHWYIPLNKAVFRKAASLPIDPYVVGAFLGGGSYSERSFTIVSNDEFVVKKIADKIGAIGYEKRKENYSWRFIRPNSTKSFKYIQTHEILSKFGYDGVFDCKSLDKYIPEIYLNSSIEQRMELLHGLMDTDGTVSDNYRLRLSFSTNSEYLMLSFRRLLWSLGYRNTMTYEDRNKNREYTVRIKLPVNRKHEVFSLPRQLEKIKNHKNYKRQYERIYDDLGIVEIEDLGFKEDINCIMVNGDSHLYQVGKEHIVTHNTSIVQALNVQDKKRYYLEVDLAKMISELNEMDKLANIIKNLFKEASDYAKDVGHEIVIFIDEFHQIMHLSRAAVEALKPILADSGTRGLRIIFATTFEEFEEYVKPNQPLVERLERINIRGASKRLVMEILRGMSKTYGVDHLFYNDSLFELIYDYTNRYIPANSQPRKSILVLDRMIGWHRYTKRPMDFSLLADVLAESEGVNVNFKVDADNIKDTLNSRVYSQEYAVLAVTQRLFVCISGLNDPTRPMGSFLFTGSTGTGKLVSDDTLVPVYDKNIKYKNHGDLKKGDYVFNRLGKPVKVLETFPHKDVKMYDVTLNDGRVLKVGDKHLWTIFTSKQRQKIHGSKYKTYPKGEVVETKDILDRGLFRKRGDRRELKYYIQANEAVNWNENDLKVDPYVMGAFIADGCLTLQALSLSNNDEEIVKKVSDIIDAKSFEQKKSSSTYHFEMKEKVGNRKLFHTKDFFESFPEVYKKKSHEKRLPKIYMTSSINQRWSLIKALFDCDGTISDDSRLRVSYSSTSYNLIKDIRYILYSLGVSSSINKYKRDGKNTEYTLRVKIENEKKYKFFTLKRKLDIIDKWNKNDKRQRIKKFDFVGIKDIKYVGVEDAQCIYVDDEEHLYQAGNFIVTHNTQLTKEMAKLLFDDSKSFIRFDMTEFALDDSLERFRETLTNRIFENPNSVILLDEIEKASKSVTHVLLQVLDDGRLLDKYNREVSFINSYIVMTTNVASDLYKEIGNYTTEDDNEFDVINRYINNVEDSLRDTSKEKFPPELLGRIDTIVPFLPLKKETLSKICIKELAKLRRRVRKTYNMELIVTEKTQRYLVNDLTFGDSDSGGARQLINIIDRQVASVIAEYVTKYPDKKYCVVDVEGEIASDHKTKRLNQGVRIVAGDKR